MKKLQTKWNIFNEYMVLYLFWGWKTTDEMGHFQRILGFIFILRGTMEWFKQNFLSLFSTFASSLTIYLVYQSLFNNHSFSTYIFMKLSLLDVGCSISDISRQGRTKDSKTKGGKILRKSAAMINCSFYLYVQTYIYFW